MQLTTTLSLTSSSVIVPITNYRPSLFQHPKPTTCLGMIGAYHERIIGLYRREIRNKRFINPYRNDFQLHDHIERFRPLVMLNESYAIDQAILASLRREINFMAKAYDLKIFTVASCGLEKFIPKLSLEFSLPAIFPSDCILQACLNFPQITLFGNQCDTALNVPLICRLQNASIEVIRPEAETMKKLINLVYGSTKQNCSRPIQSEPLAEPESYCLMNARTTSKPETLRPTLAQLEQAEIIATEIATKSQAILIMSPELDWLREVMQEHTVVISSFDLHSQAIKIALGL